MNIDRSCNHLIPVCGSKRNSSAFTVTVTSDYYFTETAPITVVSARDRTMKGFFADGLCVRSPMRSGRVAIRSRSAMETESAITVRVSATASMDSDRWTI